MNLLVTVDSGRPKAFEILTKIVKKQNTQDFHWLIICDDWEGYKFPTKDRDVTVVKRDASNDELPSMNCNYLAACDWLDKHEEVEKILIIESDDYYARNYALDTMQLLDQADLAGWNEDAYYYVLSRKARRTHNINFAALSSTAFKRSVLPYFRRCCMDPNHSIDMRLWLGIREQAYMAQPPLMKDNISIMPEPVEYSKIKEEFTGRRILANNFTGLTYESEQQVRWTDQGKFEIISNEPTLDEKGNIRDEFPRHVGMKEPWHAGKRGASSHDPRVGGAPDMWGNLLRKWIGNEDAKMYLQFTKEPPKNPYPPMVLVTLPLETV